MIVVTGPTAVGKTELCIRLSAALHAPIVNADSRQLYREMRIGTARPTDEEMGRADFRMVGCLSIEERYSAARYEEDALRELSSIFRDHRYAILSGGSMLYVDAVVSGIDEIPTIPDSLRAAIKQRLASEGLSALCEELRRIDPEYYASADLRNPRRVVHALEVYYATGSTFSSLRKHTPKKRPFSIVKIGLNLPRPALFARINARADEMMRRGLLNEARTLYPKRSLQALSTVGYNEMFRYLNGELTLDEAVARMKKNTRVYAKKQLTWYKRDASIRWFRPDDFSGVMSCVAEAAGGGKGPCVAEGGAQPVVC